MDQLNHNDAFCQSIQAPTPTQSAADFRQPLPPNRILSDSSQKSDAELNNSIAARKVQKADREKLRRDRLNEQLMELGNVIDPERPKNDKASILADTIQMLKDLTSQVNRLKAEYTTLTEESRELTQEKNDLREEKASLKSDIVNLNVQYQQRVRAMYPWAGIDHSVVMHPPSYPFPVPMQMPHQPIPLRPSFQPYPFFGNQNPGVIPNPCSTFVPYLAPNNVIEQQSVQYAPPIVQPGNRSHVSGRQDSRNKSTDHIGESRVGRSEDSNDVATELELKIPGSRADQAPYVMVGANVTDWQDSSSGQRKSKKIPRKEISITDGSSSSRCSSSPSVHDGSSNSVVGGRKADD